MVNKLIFNFSQIGKNLSFFEQSQAKFAGKRALTRFGRELKNKDIKNKYKKVFFIGEKAARFTLNSTFTLQKGLRMKVGVKDEVAMDNPTKGNPAARYLFPVLGGGSRGVYETLFMQHLKRSNYMDEGQYPFAVLDNKFIKINKRSGRVSKNTLANTMIGLGKTKNNPVKGRGRNTKIQDGRVIAFKKAKTYKTGKTYEAGIYREVFEGRGKNTVNKLTPLFLYKSIPNVGRKTSETFESLVTKIARKNIGTFWIEEAKKLAKTN